MDEVKIIYCYDKDNNIIHYSNVIKNEIYYCIDCGAELIVKDGNIKTKHLAHKNIENCGGTGESIFHKFWKENLFKKWMNIRLPNIKEPVRILNVLNEVSLKERYKKQWDRDIIVDTLLETDKGDVIIEIFYKHSKNWEELLPYYKQLNIKYIYEVEVSDCINDNLIWNDAISIMNNIEEEKNQIEEDIKYQEELKNKIFTHTCYFNYTCKPIKINDNTYKLNCISYQNGSNHKTTLIFDLNILKCTYNYLFGYNGIYNIKKGIKSGNITSKTDKVYEKNVLSFTELKNESYDKDLYIRLCKINKNNETKFKENQHQTDIIEISKDNLSDEVKRLIEIGFYTEDDIINNYKII